MSRIVAPTSGMILQEAGSSKDDKQTAAELHDFTFGITSDPLTRFSAAFAALIHDIDHRGVPNPTLVTECPEMSEHYKFRSIAEQNSFDLAWSLLMEDRYTDFRQTLCPTAIELQRFRSLVVNCVMATDIMDPELKELRNKRWETAFPNPSPQNRDTMVDVVQEGQKQEQKQSAMATRNRKATIVIEHLIQASDVAHTMQHWHVYRQWNEKLFREMYLAYRQGRASRNPADFWYQGEIGFLDGYVIPLAKKLQDCGVFGVSSAEYLNYALTNRKEWENKGQEVVMEMIESLRGEGQTPV